MNFSFSTRQIKIKDSHPFNHYLFSIGNKLMAEFRPLSQNHYVICGIYQSKMFGYDEVYFAEKSSDVRIEFFIFQMIDEIESVINGGLKTSIHTWFNAPTDPIYIRRLLRVIEFLNKKNSFAVPFDSEEERSKLRSLGYKLKFVYEPFTREITAVYALYNDKFIEFNDTSLDSRFDRLSYFNLLIEKYSDFHIKYSRWDMDAHNNSFREKIKLIKKYIYEK